MIFKKEFIILFLFSAIFLPDISIAKNSPNTNKKTPIKQQEKSLEDDDFETYETEPAIDIYDPLEKYNRKIFTFNDVIDKHFIEHIAKFYRQVAPKPIVRSVRNFLANLYSPVSAVNAIFQGNINNGLATFSSFLINSTVGVGGIFDIAGDKNIIYNREDFGQTLGHYGVGSGAYLMLPILGPSSVRDAGGLVFDKSINPIGLNILEIGNGSDFLSNDYIFSLTLASGIDTRENLIDIIDDIRKDSFDPYATIRSAYMQKRNNDLKLGDRSY